MIQLQNISKQFKETLVLHQINATFKEGELIHISGGNGSGKSTLLKIIAGLLQADQGKVIRGEMERIGALIENPHFLEAESARYNLKFLYDLTGHFDEQVVGALMKRFDLDLSDKRAMRKYSIGMRQKVGIIQAVMEHPDILLFDEPTRGLDEASMLQFFALIKELHEAGKTILICAHDGVEGISFDQVYQLRYGVLSI